MANDAQFQRLCVALNLPEAAAEPLFQRNDSRRKNRPALNQILGGRLLTQTRAHWQEKLDAQGVACGAVRDVKEAIAVAEKGERDMVVEIDHPTAGRLKGLKVLTTQAVGYACGSATGPAHAGSAYRRSTEGNAWPG